MNIDELVAKSNQINLLSGKILELKSFKDWVGQDSDAVQKCLDRIVSGLSYKMDRDELAFIISSGIKNEIDRNIDSYSLAIQSIAVSMADQTTVRAADGV